MTLDRQRAVSHVLATSWRGSRGPRGIPSSCQTRDLETVRVGMGGGELFAQSPSVRRCGVKREPRLFYGVDAIWATR